MSTAKAELRRATGVGCSDLLGVMLAILQLRESRCDCQTGRAQRNASKVRAGHRQALRLRSSTWLSTHPRLHTQCRSAAGHQVRNVAPLLKGEYQVHLHQTKRRLELEAA